MNSRNFGYRILHSPAPILLVSPLPAAPLGAGPMPLVTQMNRDSLSCMGFDYKLMFVDWRNVHTRRIVAQLAPRPHSVAGRLDAPFPSELGLTSFGGGYPLKRDLVHPLPSKDGPRVWGEVPAAY
jgi:hypothetical protein